MKRTQSGTSINSSDLPPERKTRSLTKVSAPLSKTRLTDIIYIIALGALLLSGFYAYRISQWKSQAGGWWNLALGRQPDQPLTMSKNGNAKSVEGKIMDLAELLGIQPTELASAIKPLIPPARASSLAKAKETGKSGILGALAQDLDGGDQDYGGGGGVGWEHILVGSDEPAGEMD